MKIHPTCTVRNDLAHFQLHTAPKLVDRTNGLNQLADKHRRIQRLATRARRERRWNKEEERFAWT